ncbi:MAG: tetratricopeptide repeat protein [Verrucomicrobiae bacterium]|nr:tetratricopeptide repeat protein [Verrucomicrobiae bacterium]
MNALEYPDRHHVVAAEGWFELGCDPEAMTELGRLSPAGQCHPDPLELRWRILARARNWAAALEVSGQMTQVAPDRPEGWIQLSFTLHELGRTRDAWNLLLPMASRFPEDSVIPYNLACYACQLGELKAAQQWLERAARMRPRKEIKGMALSDPDLAPLRSCVEQL